MLELNLLFVSFSIVLDGLEISKNNIHTDWNDYKTKYGLEFDKTQDDIRRLIYEENKRYIQAHNQLNNDFTLGMNRWGHMTPKEHQPCYVDKRPRNPSDDISKTKRPPLSMPSSVDWRTLGYVSSVKDQGNCGSCYAFSGVGAIESHFAIKTGIMVDMSEQEIVDCSNNFGDEGCNGGLPDFVYEYVRLKGITRLSDYSYLAKSGPCRASGLEHPFKLQDFVDLPMGNEEHLVRVLAYRGPVSIAIDATSREFRFYKSGIFKTTDCSPYFLDHAMLAIGFNNGSDPYIIVKNSWGTEWGENGYIKMALFRNNQCGIASEASYPLPKI